VRNLVVWTGACRESGICMKKRSETITECVTAVRKKLESVKSDTRKAGRRIREMQELNSLLSDDSRQLAQLDSLPESEEKGSH